MQRIKVTGCDDDSEGATLAAADIAASAAELNTII